jgi:hypothetical protein
MSNLQALADYFYDAFYSNSWRNVSTSMLSLSIADSYCVQNIVIDGGLHQLWKLWEGLSTHYDGW